MKLGEIIRRYREDHGYSLRKFAEISGVSNSYLSMLETGRQPSSGRPVVPTLTKLNQIAAAMNMRVDDLIAVMDDTPVSLQDPPAPAAAFSLSDLEKQIVIRFRALPDGEKNMLLR
jgi:transcriptional regulator with XRE-family HTH domain